METQHTASKNWVFLIITTILFYVAGTLTLPLSMPPSYATAIWPPAGIGLGAVLLWGNRVLPGIFFAELLIHYEVYDISALLNSPSELLVFFLNPFNSASRAWLGCILVKKFAAYPNELISTRLIARFFLLAGPVATLLPAALSVWGLFFTGIIIKGDLLFAFLTWWLGDCTGIAVFTPLFFIVFDRSHRIWKQRSIALGLPLILMFLLTASGYLFAQKHEVERLHKVIDHQASVIKEDLQNQFQRHLAILSLYKGLVQINPMKETDFHRVSETILQQFPSISRLEWLETGNHTEKNPFTSRYRVANQAAVNTDFPALAKFANTFDFSEQEITVTGNNEFLVFIPVSATSDGSCLCLKGTVAGVFDIKKYIFKAIDQKNLEHIVMEIIDIGDKSRPHSIFKSPMDRELFNPLALESLQTISLGQQQWLLRVTPNNKFLGENYSWSVWQLLAGGMFLTGFMSIGLLVLTGYTESVRAEVDKRTDELNQSNSKLAASEQQFRKLVQTQSAIVWRADPLTLRFLFVNDEAVSILGYPVERWLNDPDFCQKHIHHDDRESALAFCASQTRLRQNHEVEFRMIAADGRFVWLRNFIDLTVENGEVIELYGFMIDITTQKLAEEQLRLAATTFESQQGIMITDKEARILRVNKSFTDITGYTQEQIAGKNPSILKSGRHGQEFYRNFWKQLATSGKFEGEIWNRRINGEVYPLWQTITAVKNDAGEISHYVSVFSDITEKKDAENKIHAMAFYDPLTNLPNRRLMLDRFEQELAIAKRHGQFGAVIFLDLDHFKLLNDSQGHQIGDELLVQVANRLASVLRKEDTPARLGGDEFVVLLHAEAETLTVAAEHALLVSEKIREKLNEPFALNQYLHRISPSIGITLFPENNESPAVILQQADTAMYRAKASGRNAVSFFHPDMQEAADHRLNLEQHLRVAIEQGGFVLCYQPQVSDVGTVFGAEALIRWRHPDKGLVMPGDFIPIAEESSLIVDIGSWVLLEACRQIRAWQDEGVKLPFISVNVNPRQFRQKDFVDQIRYAIDSAGIAPYLLGIELTESVMVEDIGDTVAKMKALKELGLTIAMDDFGTGYSSLMYLKQMPIDVLKIDSEFVRDILNDANDVVIVETIIGMAQHLGLQVIAEGVETKEQLEFLQQRGCLAFQGYYFGAPLFPGQYAAKHFKTGSLA